MKDLHIGHLPTFLRRKGELCDVLGENSITPYQPLVAVWLLEISLIFQWYKKRGTQLLDILDDDRQYIKLTEVDLKLPAEGTTMSDAEARAIAVKRLTNTRVASILRTKLNFWKRQPLGAGLPLLPNIEVLGKTLSLAPAEMAVLSFAMIVKAFPVMESILEDQRQCISLRQCAQLISALTGFSRNEKLDWSNPASSCLAPRDLTMTG